MVLLLLMCIIYLLSSRLGFLCYGATQKETYLQTFSSGVGCFIVLSIHIGLFMFPTFLSLFPSRRGRIYIYMLSQNGEQKIKRNKPIRYKKNYIFLIPFKIFISIFLTSLVSSLYFGEGWHPISKRRRKKLYKLRVFLIAFGKHFFTFTLRFWYLL